MISLKLMRVLLYTSLSVAFGLSWTTARNSSAAFAATTQNATQTATQEALSANTNLFTYDNKADLGIKEVGNEKRGDITIQDITFTGTTDPVKAYIVAPAGNGPFAGILYVHWLGDAATTNRTEFLNEAVAIAPKGVLSVLVDTMWAKPGWYNQRVPENDYADSIKQVIELRRAMDVLLVQKRVDPKRIAYVGHDFGAMYGAVMGGVDLRAKTYVLMAGTPNFVDWYLYSAKPKDLAAYTRQMSVIDPINYVKAINNASIFFQFANTDDYVSASAAAAFYNAAQPRKQMATYNAEHSLNTTEVAADRVQWLERELDLKVNTLTPTSTPS